MCIDCGCSTEHDHSHHHHEHDHNHKHDEKTSRTIRIEEDLLAKNNRLAAINRARFAGEQLLVLNLVS